jgi:hypothetical protein
MCSENLPSTAPAEEIPILNTSIGLIIFAAITTHPQTTGVTIINSDFIHINVPSNAQ